MNPSGSEVSQCEFEYGTTSSYGSSVPLHSRAGVGLEPVEVSGVGHGPQPEHDLRLQGRRDQAGGTSLGPGETFKTAPAAAVPTVVTGVASAVRPTSASLEATVNPNGVEVSKCEFEYGTSSSYGTTAPCTPAPGAGSSPVEVSAPLTGLAPSTTYHFRVSATNSAGTGTGVDGTFTTTSSAHWFSDGVKRAEGENAPTVSWGTLTLKATTGASGQVTCHSAQAGAVLNPEGGGTGLGETTVFATFDCEQVGVCPEGDTIEVLAQGRRGPRPWEHPGASSARPQKR